MKFINAGIVIVATTLSLFISGSSHAGDLDTGYSLQQSGQLERAADFFCGYAKSHPNKKKNTPEALAMCGRLLDELADTLTERAEKQCYWGGKKGDYSCMERAVSNLNSRFGAGSFRYVHNLLYLVYAGAQYRTILQRFPRSKYAPEADFYILLRELIGHPDTVRPKIKAFLSRHKSGEWHRKGLLLWARVNEDIWYVHRRWSWVLFNNTIAPDELVVRAEPYRREALRTYKKLMKDRNTFEGQAAAREYALLNAGRDDGIIYSIVEDSHPGTLRVNWGVSMPAAGRSAAVSRTGSSPTTAVPQPTLPPARKAVSSPKKATKAPSRWGN